jgi:hypothetical protein
VCCSLATLLYFARSRFAVVVERELRCSAEQRRPTRKLNEVQRETSSVSFLARRLFSPHSPHRTARAARVNGESRTAPADAQVDRRFQMQAEKHVLSGAPAILTPQSARAEPCARVNGESRLAGRQADWQALLKQTFQSIRQRKTQ